ncbi:Wadjet anti-phage system protein JetA family protein [Haloferula sargassicola]|uniref:DUF3375 domain-containing protein n=1 Tax=Haloferula sargassicola TaxID=490096 RepID=A0ABP9UL68_9BACT
MSAPTLSEKLQTHVSKDFFRPLTRPSSAIYVDCAERLLTEAGEAGRLPHGETLAIIREVLASHPEVQLDEDEGAALRDIRQRAGQFFTRLCDSKWLEDQQLGLRDRWALVSPGLRPLLRLLRDLAEDEIAELRTFADTVRGVCETLERDDVLDPRLREPDELRATVTDLNSRLENALIQLHGVEKIIAIFDRKQRASETPAETLRLLYSEFGSGQHMVCYDALRRNGLLPRLSALRGKVADLRDHEQLKERLAQAIAEHYGWPRDEAWNRAVQALRDLEHRLSAIRLVADGIDARMAGFNQLSQQRYRYQTELRGRRPEIVKAYCDALNEQLAGGRTSQLKDAGPDFPVLSPELRFYYGSSSLARTRRVKAPADLSFGGGRVREDDEQDALAALRERQRLALTPQRAARLVSRLIPEAGETAASSDFTASTTDEMLDLLAIAAYHLSPAPGGKKVRWSIDGPGRRSGLEPASIPQDDQAGWRMDHFDITRES